MLSGALRFSPRERAFEMAALALCAESASNLSGGTPQQQIEYFKLDNYLPTVLNWLLKINYVLINRNIMMSSLMKCCECSIESLSYIIGCLPLLVVWKRKNNLLLAVKWRYLKRWERIAFLNCLSFSKLFPEKSFHCKFTASLRLSLLPRVQNKAKAGRAVRTLNAFPLRHSPYHRCSPLWHRPLSRRAWRNRSIAKFMPWMVELWFLQNMNNFFEAYDSNTSIWSKTIFAWHHRGQHRSRSCLLY